MRITHLRFFDEGSTPNIQEAVYNATTGQIGIPGTSVQTPTPTPTNSAPTFTTGSTTRTIAENTAAGRNIGSPVAATDAQNDTLTYTLGGTDANAFSVERTTGQLRTKAALDYETKRSYTVTITVSDGSLSDTITVTIAVTDVADTQTPQQPQQPGDTGGTPTLTASTTAPLTEITLDGSVVTLTLTGRNYVPWGSDISRALTVSGIDGVTKDYVIRISDTEVTVTLEFEGDFDIDATLTFTVGPGAIEDYNGPAFTQQIPVTGGQESIVASTAAPLTETTLDGSVVTLTLTGRNYVPWGSDISRALTVSGIDGVTKDYVIRISDTEITVNLEFNGDFDTDTTLTFTVGPRAIADYNGPAFTQQIPVTGGQESIVASTAAPLTETTLDGSVITLTLTGRIYAISTFDIRDAVTVSGIDGVTIPWHQPNRESDTEITVELEFEGDFDTSSTLTFTVGADAIADYNGPAFTQQIPVTGGQESIVASTAAPLTEITLDGSVVTLTLTGRIYAISTFDIRDAVTVSGIDGVTIPWHQPNRESDTEITVELEFEGDFDTNSTLTFTVGPGAIEDYNGPAFTQQIPVTGGQESIVASTAAPLTEITLDGSVVTLTLTGRIYAISTFDIRDAVTVSGIDGVTIPWHQPNRESDTEITVELEFEGDFDTNSTLTFTVGPGAIEDYNGPAFTQQIPVTGGQVSIVASTAAPLTEITLDGSVVTLTLTGRIYAISTFDIRDAVTVSGIDGVTIPWHQPNRESDTEITVELEFEGDFDTNSTLTFTVGIEAIANYDGPAFTAQVPVTATEQVLQAPSGISLIHVPLRVTAVDGVAQTIESVSNLYDALGGADTVNLLTIYDPKTQSWHSYLGESSRGTVADTVLADYQGVIANMKTPVSLQLEGDALGSNGNSVITLHPGTNLVGMSLKDPRITRVSDLFALEGIGNNASTITVLNNGTFQTVEQAGDAGDIPITGGQSFILNAREAATVAISGQGWDNVSGTTAAAPGALTGIKVGDTTPVLALMGSVISSVGEWGRMPHLRPGPGFRVIVKNLSTRKSVATVTGDTGDSYQLTVVDTETGRAAQIGDILEISVRSPDPRIGAQPLRHTVTAEDVKWSRVELGNLIVYEIPTETALLPNYPNPFNPETWIPYRLAEDAFVTLTIYDTTGQVVRSIDVGYKPAAVYESRAKAIYWNGRNEFGERAASGVYFYHLSAGDFSATRKMLILK